MIQVDFIRRCVIKKMNELRIYISMLPAREEEALQRLHGPEGVKTAARIADYVLEQLGHPAPNPAAEQCSPSVREARKVMPSKAALK